jgi:hypothetical protein
MDVFGVLRFDGILYDEAETSIKAAATVWVKRQRRSIGVTVDFAVSPIQIGTIHT